MPEWLGCAENVLGLKEFADAHGHERVLISETGPGLDPLLAGSGMAPEAQRRCAEGVRDSLERFFAGTPLDRDHPIVESVRFVSASYSYAFT